MVFDVDVFARLNSQLELIDYLRDHFYLELLWVIIILLDVFSSQDQLESVLDLRFGSTFDEIGNFSPFVSHLKPFLKEIDVFFETPLLLIDRRV